MINTAQQLERLDDPGLITIRAALPDGKDVLFMDSLQKKFRKQVGFLPTVALEEKIARGQVSLALENGEPAAYLLGNGNYKRDAHFGIIYQAAVSYDARRRLVGTALVQHFIECMEPDVRLVGLWCAQDIEANEFWSACGFEAIAARQGSKSRGRVHIFWVGRTPGRGESEPLRFPKSTSGGLMREKRRVIGLAPGSAYQNVVVPGGVDAPATSASGSKSVRGISLADQRRAFRYGGSGHVCVVLHGVSRYLPVAPFDVPDFAELARVAVATGSGPTRDRGSTWQHRAAS